MENSNELLSIINQLFTQFDWNKRMDYLANQLPNDNNIHLKHAILHLSEKHLIILHELDQSSNINAVTINQNVKLLQGTLSKNLLRLQKFNLIEKKVNPESKRERLYSLTMLGKKIVAADNQLNRNLIKKRKKVISKYNNEEIQAFIKMLKEFQLNNLYK
ncbi:hypothetical protein [Liquorilactobacillus satsumensis]|uniref:hypothetical protein n=1 Tax=Liquorilactobacillus satsumensis TaxID=259059 RepID=UPI0007052D87|nr:hypothetical protein [Liquorilactobacillus satsumensis]